MDISSVIPLAVSSNSSRNTRYWFLAYNVVKGRSTSIMVDSLVGAGQRLSHFVQCLSQGSGLGFCNMLAGKDSGM